MNLKRSKGRDPFEGFSQVVEIGRGSFATVYRAVDSYTGQPVALKLLSVASGRRFDDTMFELEARALGAVSGHPNIVTLHRATVRSSGPLLVLELCDGSLADRVARQGPLPAREVIAAGIKLAGALETAHQAGILHRDLKPQNVLVTRYGEPALADFGVAELRDTISGGSPLSGLTLLHAAPEVILGHPATPASDVYGLVSTLYELAGGHAPYFVTSDEDPAVLQRRLLHDPVPRLEAPELPATFRGLLERALAKDPADRPSSARELAEYLRLLERASGWGPTPCRIDGGQDLPMPPEERPDEPPSTLGRAAATTGIPPLGLATRPFSGRPLQSVEHEPVPASLPRILPTAPRETLRPVEPSTPDPDPAADPQAPTSDPPPTPAADAPTSPATDLPEAPAPDTPSPPATDLPEAPAPDTPNAPAANVPGAPSADPPDAPDVSPPDATVPDPAQRSRGGPRTPVVAPVSPDTSPAGDDWLSAWEDRQGTSFWGEPVAEAEDPGDGPPRWAADPDDGRSRKLWRRRRG